jgi:CxxC motif-containing protein (DUF1111 family)
LTRAGDLSSQHTHFPLHIDIGSGFLVIGLLCDDAKELFDLDFNRGTPMIVRSKLRVLLPASVAVTFIALPFIMTRATGQELATDAPAAFDNQTNGFESQSLFNDDREAFEKRARVEDGLGPVYNATSCVDCHQNPVTGGASQVTVLRAGTLENGVFKDHPGGSLIHDRAIHPDVQERVIDGYEVRTSRTSLNILGSGFVEAVADKTLTNIQDIQPPSMRGTIVRVPVLEANNTLGIGRFGWKNQHASLESFAADAFLNEMGITSVLQPTENTSSGNSVRNFDNVPDPEDDGAKVQAVTRFMRSTKAPPRDEKRLATEEGKAGAAIYIKIGCAECHIPQILTAPVGTVINGTFIVPPALGNKVFQPYGDFLLHDIGTGDGIVQNGGQVTRDKIRTAPLWGLRTRNRLMHDGESRTVLEAIMRHRGQATEVLQQFVALNDFDKWLLLTFLSCL